MLAGPGALDDDLVVESVSNHAAGMTPEQVVVSAAEAVEAVDADGLNRFALAFATERRSLLDLHVDIDELFDRDELVETQAFLFLLRVVVLHQFAAVGLIVREAEGGQFGVL